MLCCTLCKCRQRTVKAEAQASIAEARASADKQLLQSKLREAATEQRFKQQNTQLQSTLTAVSKQLDECCSCADVLYVSNGGVSHLLNGRNGHSRLAVTYYSISF